MAWINQFILYHGKRHPQQMGASEVEQFLSYLASDRKVSSSTQNQALSALLFLYREVLQTDLAWVGSFSRSKVPRRLPTALTQLEAKALLAKAVVVAPAPYGLILLLLYCTGLQLLEAQRVLH